MAKIEGIESPNPTIASNEFVLKRRYSWSDHEITIISVSVVAMPSHILTTASKKNLFIETLTLLLKK
jgi:hypothetical protein